MSVSRAILTEAYTKLELSHDASDHEVKSAYKKLALKHHPGE